MPFEIVCANKQCRKSVFRKLTELKNREYVFCSGQCRAVFYRALLNKNLNQGRLANSHKWKEFICQQCHNTFINKYSTKLPRQFCSRLCFAKSLEIEPYTYTCESCGTSYTSSKKKSTKYCSHKCYSKTLVGKSKTLTHDQIMEAQELYQRNTSMLEIAKRFSCDPVTIKRALKANDMVIRAYTNNPTKHGKNSPHWKDRVVLTCHQCTKTFEVQPFMEHRQRFCSTRCGLTYTLTLRTSNLEVLIAKAFSKLKMKFEPQFPIDRMTVDFAFPEEMLVVECDGKYWHRTPKQLHRDQKRDALLLQKGWYVLRFKEDNINADPNCCAQQVKTILLERRSSQMMLFSHRLLLT